MKSPALEHVEENTSPRLFHHMKSCSCRQEANPCTVETSGRMSPAEPPEHSVGRRPFKKTKKQQSLRDPAAQHRQANTLLQRQRQRRDPTRKTGMLQYHQTPRTQNGARNLRDAHIFDAAFWARATAPKKNKPHGKLPMISAQRATSDGQKFSSILFDRI